VHWVVFNRQIGQDFRWFMVYTELWLSAVFVLTAWLVASSKTRTLRILLWANLWISALDIVNYWLWFRHNEWVLRAEFLVMIVATVLIISVCFNKTTK
jgi:hypothetical protein